MEGVEEEQVTPYDMKVPVIVFCGIAVALALLLVVLFKPKLRRLKVDRSAANVNTLADSNGDKKKEQELVLEGEMIAVK